VEAIWSHAKYSTLANLVHDDVDHPTEFVVESVGELQWDNQFKRSFFQTAELPI